MLIYNFPYPCEKSSDCHTQEIVLSRGKYKIEAWGASGGSNETCHGGKGGYAEILISLSTQRKLYLNVGGKGEFNTINNASGGYNGGGNGYCGTLNIAHSSGGGASDVRYSLDPESRILVAAGGGGFGSCGYFCIEGGSGGGASGSDGEYYKNDKDNAGKGATQENPGSKGTQSCFIEDSPGKDGELVKGGDGGGISYGSGGGGGGYYGGGGAYEGGGGGGSSYFSSDFRGLTIPGNELMPLPNYSHDYGNDDNGYIRIKKMESCTNIRSLISFSFIIFFTSIIIK